VAPMGLPPSRPVKAMLAGSGRDNAAAKVRDCRASASRFQFETH
jgi:hypothetical protein